MGRIRPNFIKRIAKEAKEKYAGELGADFYKNREFLGTVLDVGNAKLLNKVAGYVTNLVTKKEIY